MATAFTVSHTAIHPTKFTQSGCAEETLFPMFASVVSTMPPSFSRVFAPIRRRRAVGWHEYCMLRYSNRSMCGVMETDQTLYIWDTQNVSSNVDEIFQDLRTLLEDLKNRAASGNSLRKFATGNASAPNFQGPGRCCLHSRASIP
ncbi:hypothetical protein L484_005302 [Morus notabilis]|uniref:Uncharacterized protein n=1 Tax=Morus notabilis TaxID=981085 RepID=W9RBT4_9ROSA|nr:hypothetical protein L484_005302 [Morus notabilis]